MNDNDEWSLGRGANLPRESEKSANLPRSWTVIHKYKIFYPYRRTGLGLPQAERIYFQGGGGPLGGAQPKTHHGIKLILQRNLYTCMTVIWKFFALFSKKYEKTGPEAWQIGTTIITLFRGKLAPLPWSLDRMVPLCVIFLKICRLLDSFIEKKIISSFKFNYKI